MRDRGQRLQLQQPADRQYQGDTTYAEYEEWH